MWLWGAALLMEAVVPSPFTLVPRHQHLVEPY
jgi:hypothetical protein